MSKLRAYLALGWLVLTIVLLHHLQAPTPVWSAVQAVVLGINWFCLLAWLADTAWDVGRYLVYLHRNRPSGAEDGTEAQ